MNEIWIYGCEDLDDYFESIEEIYGNNRLDSDSDEEEE